MNPQPRTGTYHTHYASHADEPVEILDEVRTLGEPSSYLVRFADGATEMVPASTVTCS